MVDQDGWFVEKPLSDLKEKHKRWKPLSGESIFGIKVNLCRAMSHPLWKEIVHILREGANTVGEICDLIRAVLLEQVQQQLNMISNLE